ncbi:MAG: protein kinase [Elusimicrobia bacterium]|nr:protein kinase [Elusimicrobiota bacterium]
MRRVLLPSLVFALAAGWAAAADTPSASPPDASKTLSGLGGPPLMVSFRALGDFCIHSLAPKQKPGQKPAAGAGTPAGQAAAPPASDVGNRLAALWVRADEQKKKDPKASDQQVVANAMLDAAVVLSDPPPPDVDKKAYAQARDRAGELLNRVGGSGDTKPYQASLSLSQKVLQDEPADRDALNNMAGAQLGLGRYEEAILTATRVTDQHKDDERAFTTRALAHYQMKQYAQALQDAKMALRIDPNNSPAFQIAQLAKTRVTTAGDLGLDAAQKEAADQVKREYEGMLDERGRAEEAAAAPQAPAAIPSSAPDSELAGLVRQAANKVKMGDLDGARQDAETVLSRDPWNVGALETRARVASLTGDYKKAADDATSALQRKPDDEDALLTRSHAEGELGEWPQALLDADKAVAAAPSDPFAYKARARAKEGSGDLAGMLDDLRSAAKYGPQFDADLRETAAKYGLSLGPDGRGSAAAPAAPSSRGRARLLVILASSVLGLLLIAGGLLHAFAGVRVPLLTRLSGPSSETAKALAAAGGLGAGYEIVRTLGQGGMGVVYEAVDKALERRVAVKKMRDEIRLDGRERARFLQEARIVAQMHHPNIVEIHTIVSEGDDLYLVFEFVEGHTVDQIIERKGRLTVPEAQWVLHGAAKALEYAHQRGVVHRDLKPSNIMLEKDGTVKVMDFGIARQAKDALARSTMTGTVAGTPQYMAPEQEEGVVRPESDVFSLGAMLYEMVTGQRPYPAPSTTASKLAKRYEKPSRLAGNLPPELESLIDDCLEPDPEKRPRTAAEFRARLDALRAAAPAKTA